jgi:peroxiredoxin Q/BCP
VVHFAVSVDDPDTNRKFAEELEADYPILSDPEKQVAAAYGVLGASGFANRTTFYIGPDGRILDIDRKISVRTAGEDIAKRLAELGVAKKQ